MKLTDLATSNDVKVLVYGPSSTGKTCFSCSFPTPIRYMDFDNKVSSAAQHYKSDIARLSEIEVSQYAVMPRETRMKTFNADISTISQNNHNKKDLGFKTLVVDSLTTLSNFMLEDFMFVSRTDMKRPGVGQTCRADYQLLEYWMRYYIQGMLSLNCNVVFVGHSHQDKDETSGAVTNQLLMPGKFASRIPIYFEEIYFSKVDQTGKYMLQTTSDHKTLCRTQRKLPKEIQTHYNSILGVK